MRKRKFYMLENYINVFFRQSVLFKVLFKYFLRIFFLMNFTWFHFAFLVS